MPSPAGALLALAVWVTLMGSAAGTTRSGPAGSTLSAVPFESLAGWREDDHLAAFAAFRRSCEGIIGGSPELRPGLPTPPALVAACRSAMADPPGTPGAARAWFERQFRAWRVTPAEGRPFLTGYFEPEVEGATEPSAAFPAPIRGRPSDLVSFPDGAPAPLPPGLRAARATPGGLRPFPDRAAIDDGALDGQGLELVWLRDAVEAFMIHVQGSARVRLADGRVIRLAYAGRNGHPYTSIGRVVVDEGHATPEEMHLEGLKAWLRARPGEARRIMRLNRSYIFFSVRTDLDPSEGPVGAASVSLTPFRSLAVDRTAWPYGTPVWLDVGLPRAEGTTDPFRALLVAQDTGTAIVGPARGDLFHGAGPEAGRRAGMLRHRPDFVVLLPREQAP